MDHENKNRILNHFFAEDSGRESKEIRAHLKECDQCREYLNDLELVETACQELSIEKPLPNTLELIMEELPAPIQKHVSQPDAASPLPFMEIAGGVLLSVILILLSLYFIPKLTIWTAIEETWLLQTFGLLPVVVAVFFLIGSLCSLALYPVIYFESDPDRQPLTFQYEN